MIIIACPYVTVSSLQNITSKIRFVCPENFVYKGLICSMFMSQPFAKYHPQKKSVRKICALQVVEVIKLIVTKVSEDRWLGQAQFSRHIA
jgi:hypothetical protein